MCFSSLFLALAAHVSTLSRKLPIHITKSQKRADALDENVRLVSNTDNKLLIQLTSIPDIRQRCADIQATFGCTELFGVEQRIPLRPRDAVVFPEGNSIWELCRQCLAISIFALARRAHQVE